MTESERLIIEIHGDVKHLVKTAADHEGRIRRTETTISRARGALAAWSIIGVAIQALMGYFALKK